jgi:hypothetical protein
MTSSGEPPVNPADLDPVAAQFITEINNLLVGSYDDSGIRHWLHRPCDRARRTRYCHLTTAPSPPATGVEDRSRTVLADDGRPFLGASPKAGTRHRASPDH